MEEAKFIKQRSDPNTDRVEIWKTKFSADLLVRMKLLTLTSKYCSVFISDMLKLTKNNVHLILSCILSRFLIEC